MNAGYSQAQPLIQQAENTTTNYGNTAMQPFQQAYASNSAGAQQLSNALGFGGQAGTDSALSTLQNTPGYQFSLQQGEQATDRGAAAKGMVSSGNTIAAEDQYSQGLAQQNYNNYVSQLEPYLGAQNTSAAGISQAAQNTGNTLNTDIGNNANLAYNTQAGIGTAQSAADLGQAQGDMSFLNGVVGLGTKLIGAASGSPSAGAPAPAAAPITTNGLSFGVPNYSPYAAYPEV